MYIQNLIQLLFGRLAECHLVIAEKLCTENDHGSSDRRFSIFFFIHRRPVKLSVSVWKGSGRFRSISSI